MPQFQLRTPFHLRLSVDGRVTDAVLSERATSIISRDVDRAMDTTPSAVSCAGDVLIVPDATIVATPMPVTRRIGGPPIVSLKLAVREQGNNPLCTTIHTFGRTLGTLNRGFVLDGRCVRYNYWNWAKSYRLVVLPRLPLPSSSY